MNIEKFRSELKKTRERLRKVYIYKLSLAYGLIEENNDNIEFYFEKHKYDKLDKGIKHWKIILNEWKMNGTSFPRN